MHPRRHFIHRAVAALLLSCAALSPTLAAPGWPDKPIQFVVPLPPGGSYDYLARALAEPLQARLGQPVVVENRSGADGRIGTAYLERQPPTGDAIGIIAVTNVIHPSLFKEIPYDILADFAPLGLIAHAPFVLVAGPGLKDVTTAREFMDYARQHPGAVTYGSSGVGSPFHLGGELLASAAQLDMLHVPFRGSGPLIPALLGGDVMAAVVPVGPYLPHIQSGALRPLGTLTEERISTLPDVPTLDEALGLQGVAMTSWLGLVAPAGTPAAVIDRLNQELRAIVEDPAFVAARLQPQAYEALPSSPEEMARIMRQDHDKYAAIVKQAGIRVD